MKYFYTYELWEGTFEIVETDNAVCEIAYYKKDNSQTGYSANVDRDRPGMTQEETPLIRKAAQELAEYFAGERTTFDIPMMPEGTAFQRKVWQALVEIPYGKTRSYCEIAAEAGSPKGARAAGMACHNNPIMIMVPCHRVIGKSGALTGFGGGLDMKEKLLGLELKNNK